MNTPLIIVILYKILLLGISIVVFMINTKNESSSIHHIDVLKSFLYIKNYKLSELWIIYNFNISS